MNSIFLFFTALSLLSLSCPAIKFASRPWVAPPNLIALAPMRHATWASSYTSMAMEGQFEDAFPALEKPVPNKSNDCQSEEDVGSDWTYEGDYEPNLEDYNWENEIGNFSKKLAAVRSGTQPNSNRRQPLACGDHSKAIGSKTFAVNSFFVFCVQV